MGFDDPNARVRSTVTPEGRIVFRHWTSGKQAGVLVHLHGIESHSGWFSETAAELCGQGYEIYAADRVGSGLSEGRRGDVTSWRVWLRHVQAILEIAQDENPDLPLYLAASCWGARLALT